MEMNSYRITVGLYLRGDDLDPDFVSKRLGVTPTDSQRKGDKVNISQGREVVRRIGMWALLVESTGPDASTISSHINSLASRFTIETVNVQDIDGVQEAYFDVFIATYTNENNECTVDFQIEKDDLFMLYRFGIPIHFSISTGPR